MSDRDYIERAILSELLRRPERIGELAALCRVEDFTEGIDRNLFRICLDLYRDGKPLDDVSIRFALGDAEDDTWKKIREWFSTECGDLAAYAGMLRERRRADRLRELGGMFMFTETLPEMEKLVSEMSDVVAGKADTTVVTAAGAAQEFFARITSSEKPNYLHWGFETLDKLIFTEPGDFVAIGGYPSSGKTLFALQVAALLAEKQRIGFFSLETSPRKVTDRLMCHLSRVPMGKIKTRDLNKADWAAMTDAADRLSRLQLDIIPAAGMSVQEIEAISLNRKYEIIFVDYLQIVDSGPKDRFENVTQTSLQFHRMAQRHQITVIALAQFRRPDKTSGKKPVPPSMADFRESGQIEQDVDIALLLYPSDPNDNRSSRVLKIGKNKESERAQIDLRFDGAIQRFTEIPKSSYSKLQEGLREYDRRERANPSVALRQLPLQGSQGEPGQESMFENYDGQEALPF